jgi:hypothetical protein
MLGPVMRPARLADGQMTAIAGIQKVGDPTSCLGIVYCCQSSMTAAELFAEADFGPASDTLAFTFQAWDEAA